MITGINQNRRNHQCGHNCSTIPLQWRCLKATFIGGCWTSVLHITYFVASASRGECPFLSAMYKHKSKWKPFFFTQKINISISSQLRQLPRAVREVKELFSVKSLQWEISQNWNIDSNRLSRYINDRLSRPRRWRKRSGGALSLSHPLAPSEITREWSWTLYCTARCKIFRFRFWLHCA